MRFSRFIFIPLLAGLLFLSACGGAAATEAVEEIMPSPVPATPAVPIRVNSLAWFYKPPHDSDTMQVLAKYFNYFILTHNDEQQRDELRDANSASPYLQYLLANSIYNPGNCKDDPLQNNVAYRPGDYCSLLEQHPDWFLNDVEGNLVEDTDTGLVMMDPGNPGWQEFFLQRAQQMQSQYQWNGVFLDNVDAGLRRTASNTITLQQYPDDASFQAATESFLAFLYINYFAPKHRPLLANIVYLENADVYYRYLNFLDGAMIESWAADWEKGYLSTADWEMHMQIAEKTQELGKTILLVTQGNVNDTRRQQFAYGSFLLVNHGKAYFRYTNDLFYREAWLFPNYDIDLGQPLGPRYKVGRTWRRNFEKGTVTVDPMRHEANIQTN